jgi:hypothetical protein
MNAFLNRIIGYNPGQTGNLVVPQLKMPVVQPGAVDVAGYRQSVSIIAY